MVDVSLKKLKWITPVLFALTVFCAYSTSLSTNFLNYDDGWLIENNPYFAENSPDAPMAIWFDLSEKTRLTFGAEYLPIRDTSMWLMTRLLGLESAMPIRIAQLMLYVLAMLFFRAMLRRIFKENYIAEVAAWIFALHPVHTESAAWLAGHKDVLALLFVGAALYVHAGTGKYRAIWVPVLVACAVFSKSMSVCVVALLVANDLLSTRKLQWNTYWVSAVVVTVSLVLHVHVGGIVGMFSQFAGDSRYSAFCTMGPVWLKYAALSIIPWNLSVAHDVPIRFTADLLCITGYLAISITGGTGIWLWIKKRPFTLGCWIWFMAPLIPVSQVIAPLQNVMADRYLWLSVMAPAIVIALGLTISRIPARITQFAPLLIMPVLFALTCSRAVLFSDSELLFADATQKTTQNAKMPYQLGKALEKKGKNKPAIAAFMESIRRAPKQSDVAAMATNNLARLLVIENRLIEAEKWLRRGAAIWPQNEKIRRNLAKVRVKKNL